MDHYFKEVKKLTKEKIEILETDLNDLSLVDAEMFTYKSVNFA